ncbi:hypothetical protein PMAYCL1PPCAC_19607, partial [Pristionchus mayeri]
GKTEDQLATAEKWRRESHVFANHSNDPLISLAAKGFETFGVVLSNDSFYTTSPRSILIENMPWRLRMMISMFCALSRLVSLNAFK